MPRKKQDIKTAEKLDEADELELMCRGRGWIVAKGMLMQEIMNLGDIMAFKETDPTKLSVELAARQMAIEILWSWIRKIDSAIKTKNAYQETFNKSLEMNFVVRNNEDSQD